MGHHDLPGLPRTPRFKRVIAMLGDSAGGPGAAGVGPASLPAIADATLSASDRGLERARTDEGVGYCLYLLTMLPIAARENNFSAALADLGVPAPVSMAAPNLAPDYSVFDLVSGFGSAVDRHLRATRSRTDIGELAQLAASEALNSLCGQRMPTLFESDLGSVQDSLRGLATDKGFATVTHAFLSRFSRRYLEYHLGRELSNHVGVSRRFANIGGHNQFLQQLDDYCHVATTAVKKFASEWYGKHRYQQDISLRKVKGFVVHAIDKVRDAFKFQEARDGK